MSEFVCACVHTHTQTYINVYMRETDRQSERGINACVIQRHVINKSSKIVTEIRIEKKTSLVI